MISEKFPTFVPISSFFLETVNKEKPEKLPTFKSHNIGLMPCNVGAHWFLALILIQAGAIVIFDSMGNMIEIGKSNFWFIICC